MLVPYGWLKEYVAAEITADEAARLLTSSGVAVESVRRSGTSVSGTVIARVLAIEPHPHADRLLVAAVDPGSGPVRVVCGAPNLQVNSMVVLALLGARIGDRRIERTVVRGVESCGMLCSARELGLFEDRPEHEAGILVLEAGAPPGTDASLYLGLDDAVLELDLTPNRGDCLSMIGVARELAAVCRKELRLPSMPVLPSDDGIDIQIDVPSDCARYAGLLLDDIRIGPSPDWMQLRLRAAGMRPIFNLVDITNYVMLELGQPLHAFDLQKLAGPTITVRRARDSEMMRTLDGKDRVLDPDMLVIADDDGPIALAGVMGGERTEVTKETTGALIESANFLPRLVRRTSRRLGLPSEAAVRFERSVDPEAVSRALFRTAELVAGLDIARPRQSISDRYPGVRPAETIVVNTEQVNGLLGLELTAPDMADCLSRLGFEVQVTDNALSVQLTTRRPDVRIAADISEEIARLYGYDRIESTLPRGLLTLGEVPPRLQLARTARDLLVSGGLVEVVNQTFVDPGCWERWSLPADHPWRQAIRIENPLSEDRSLLRTTLLVGLVSTLARNAARQVGGMSTFEIGTCFVPRSLPLTELPDEPLRVAMAAMGAVRPKAWHEEPVRADFYYARGAWEIIAQGFRITDWQLEPACHPGMFRGRTADIITGGVRVGVVGELDPDLISEWRLVGPACILEVDLESFRRPGIPQHRPLSRYPAAMRDLAIIASEDIPAASLEGTIVRTGGDLLEQVSLFDVYSGPGIPAGSRSLAFALSFRHAERTLSEAEIEDVLVRVQRALEAEHGAGLRG